MKNPEQTPCHTTGFWAEPFSSVGWHGLLDQIESKLGWQTCCPLFYLLFTDVNYPGFDFIISLMIENWWHNNAMSTYRDVIEIMEIIM